MTRPELYQKIRKARNLYDVFERQQTLYQITKRNEYFESLCDISEEIANLEEEISAEMKAIT